MSRHYTILRGPCVQARAGIACVRMLALGRATPRTLGRGGSLVLVEQMPLLFEFAQQLS